MVINTAPGRVYFLSFWVIFSCFNGVLHGQEFKSLKMHEKSLIDFTVCNELPGGKSSRTLKRNLLGDTCQMWAYSSGCRASSLDYQTTSSRGFRYGWAKNSLFNPPNGNATPLKSIKMIRPK